ncbi:MAG: acyl-CoA thioesterase [Chloroflexi bacterium]|nr:acyl-CoA thioesterase [Chloroflexota bacterium]
MHTFTRTFRVRSYECDAYGHVNNVNYLRYMQEAAFDASAARGYDQSAYAAMGRLFLVRGTEIDYLQPLRYGDSVAVTTWVSDFRRVRSQRAYELKRVADDVVVARAATDWVFLDRDTQRPATIPEALIAAFFPDGVPPVQPRPPFPVPPPPPPGAFHMRRRVGWQEIDSAGHVNNAAYLGYADDAGMEVSIAHGWPLARMMKHGFGIVARRHQIEYREAATLGDEIDVQTWVSDVKRVSADRHYLIRRAADGVVLTRVRSHFAWVDLASGRPIRIPPQFLNDFAANIAS